MVEMDSVLYCVCGFGFNKEMASVFHRNDTEILLLIVFMQFGSQLLLTN